jgi:hypothetical protein
MEVQMNYDRMIQAIQTQTIISMKSTFVIIVYLFIATSVCGQPTPLVWAKAIKISQDSVCRYRIIVFNRCDSVLVIPHSEFFKITEVQNDAIGLALYNKGKNIYYYDLIYSWKDTLLDPQKYLLSADYILPFQKLDFEIVIKPFPQAGILSLNVFFVYNIDYRTFLQSVKNSWMRDFSVKSIELALEK